jgi:hypothetical protein
MEPGEDRARSFHRQPAYGAIGAIVDLLDNVRAPCNVSEIRIELDCVFHFRFSFLFVF